MLGLLQANEFHRQPGDEGPVGTGSPRRFLWLAKQVDEGFYARFQVEKARLHAAAQDVGNVRGIRDATEREHRRLEAAALAHALDGVGFIKTVKRRYPMGSLAAAVLGATNDYGGLEGLEAQLDDLLKGRMGSETLLKDALRRTLLVTQKGYQPAENGYNVWLTLDTVIQNIAEDELANACTDHNAESGVAIVLEPQTGRVLALASWPTYDPNDFDHATPIQRRNHAFDPYEPGSVFKSFVLSVALEHHVVTPTTVFDCHMGRWNDPTGRLVKDDAGYGMMTVTDILVKSSNIGMSQVGWKMGIPMQRAGVLSFGFGSRTGIECPGDEKGIVTSAAKWGKGTLTSVSFGYEIGATPIQLVRAYATFANGGYLVTPRIIHAVEVAPGKAVSWEELAGPPLEKQILSAQTCATMRNIMEGVYMTGTAKRTPSKVYRLFGKTGTAHLAIQGAGHYASDEYNASFLAGGPMTNPRLVAIVTLHKPDPKEGHFGGTVAAPACTHIMERSLMYMQVPGDQTQKPSRVTPLAMQ